MWIHAAILNAKVRGGEKGLACRSCSERKIKTCIMGLSKDAIWLPGGG
jgi:hypothetical protein